jgi:hypothetical protein
MSLIDCLGKANMSQAQQRYIVDRAREHEKNGLDESEAAKQAIRDIQHETLGQLHSVYHQVGIEKYAPKASPEHITLANKLRGYARKIEGNHELVHSDLLALPKAITSTLLKGAANILEAGGHIKDAIEHIVNGIKEHFKSKGEEIPDEDLIREHAEKLLDQKPEDKREVKAKKALEDIKDFIDRKPDFSGNIEEDRRTIDGMRKSMVEHALRVIKNLPAKFKDAALQEKVYHHMEDPLVELNDTEKEFRDTYVQPMQEALSKLYEKISGENPDLVQGNENLLFNNIGYVPRQVVGQNSLFDRAKNAVKGIGGSKLKKTATSLNKRSYGAAIDQEGNRTTVIKKDGGIYRMTPQGIGDKLGDTGKAKLSDVIDLRDKTLKESGYEKNKSDLETELKTLTRSGKVEAAAKQRIENIKEHLQHLEDVKKGLDDFHDTTRDYGEAEDHLAELKKQFDQTPWKETAKRNDLRDQMNEVRDAMDKLKEKADKYIVGKDGKLYQLGDATVKEIESNTSTRYYKYPLTNFLNATVELKQVQMAADFLDGQKSKLEDEGSILKLKPNEPAPEGWAKTNLLNFRDYAFPKKIAAELNRLANLNKENSLDFLRNINNIFRNAIVFGIGTKHWHNEINLWLKEGGLVNRLAHPYVQAKAGIRAFDALFNKTPDYFNVLEHGGSIMNLGTTNYSKAMMEATVNELKSNETTLQKISNALGYARPDKLIQALSNFSHTMAMGSHDLLMMQSVFEKMERGMDIKDAIRETNKFIPNYDIPSTILGQEWISKVARDPNYTMFTAYHYGVLRSYGNMIRDFVKGAARLDGKMVAKSVDRMAMAALVNVVMYPVLDHVAQSMFGSQDDRKRVRRAGSSSLDEHIYKLSTHQEDWAKFILAYATPAQGWEIPAEIALNANFDNSFHAIRETSDPITSQLHDVGKFVESKFSPADNISQAVEGKKNLLEDQLDIQKYRMPAQRKMDLLWKDKDENDRRIKILKSQARDLFQKGDTSASHEKMHQAIELQHQWNEKMLKARLELKKEADEEGIKGSYHYQSHKAASGNITGGSGTMNPGHVKGGLH